MPTKDRQSFHSMQSQLLCPPLWLLHKQEQKKILFSLRRRRNQLLLACEIVHLLENVGICVLNHLPPRPSVYHLDSYYSVLAFSIAFPQPSFPWFSRHSSSQMTKLNYLQYISHTSSFTLHRKEAKSN